MHYLRQAGLKAAARSALPDARVWFEQALGVLEALPESPSTLEQAFEIRLELRPVLNQLGEVRRALERLREAEALAERLNDDRRRGRVCAFMTNAHTMLGELDEALVTGTRALEIAGRLGDLRLRILTTSYLEQAHYYRGEYERVVELATDNLAALPADWVYEYFGLAAPPSVFDRSWLVMSLAQLGRFAEAAEYEAEAIRLAEPTQHAYTVGLAHLAAGTLHLLKGDWAKARSLIEHWIAVVRTGNVVLQLPAAVASSAWALAQLGEASEALNRLREGEQLLERQAARGLVAYRGWAYHSLGRAGLLLGRLDEARRLGDRAVESSPGQPGFAAHALHLLGDIATHPDRFDAESGEAHYREALALAEPRGMRPLVAHCHLGLGKLYRRTGNRAKAAGAPHHRDDDVPRDGHALLAGAGGGGVGWSRAMTRVERRAFLVGTLALLAAPFGVGAQPPVIGFVRSPSIEAVPHIVRRIPPRPEGDGQATSHTTGRAYGLLNQVADVLAVLEALQLSKAHFLGYSMGGRIGLGLAKYAPERVESLVIGGTHPYADQSYVDAFGPLDGGDPEAFLAALERVLEEPIPR